MNKRQKETQQVFLDNEKAVLKKLEENYQDALVEINDRIERLLARKDADMQNVIYQVEYQKALKAQVEAILEQLHANEFETVSAYLSAAYEDGFIATMYDLQGQGIPLVIPIDQKQVAIAIQHETKLSDGLYDALGKDTKRLSKQIASEISRGISNAATYDEMARNISSFSRIPLNNAARIARTEAHRIQNKATADAQWKAKEKGADVVKQWDSTLDGKTRPHHRKLDGQIRELDEPFEVNGMSAMQPGDFGDPAEDCNCRCALLQRARWALENDFTKWDHETGGLVEIKAKDYDSFKMKYEKESERVQSRKQKELSPDEINSYGRKAIWNHWDEYRQKYFKNAVPISEVDLDNPNMTYDTFNILRLNNENVENRVVNTLENLGSKYYSPLTAVRTMEKEEALGNHAFATSFHGWGYGTAEIKINPLKLNEKGIDRIRELSETGYSVTIPKGKEVEYIITHEYGHTILNVCESLPSKSKNFVQADFSDVQNARKKIEEVFGRYVSDVKKLQDEYDSISKPLDSKLLFEGIAPTDEERNALKQARERLEALKISKYSLTHIDEFVAESFADVEVGENPSEYSKEVHSIITKYFGKGK